jgi:hypothetical protein
MNQRRWREGWQKHSAADGTRHHSADLSILILLTPPLEEHEKGWYQEVSSQNPATKPGFVASRGFCVNAPGRPEVRILRNALLPLHNGEEGQVESLLLRRDIQRASR